MKDDMANILHQGLNVPPVRLDLMATNEEVNNVGNGAHDENAGNNDNKFHGYPVV